MISIDVGQTKGGKHFLCIADRFSGYIWVQSLSGAGTSKQIIEHIMMSLGGLFGGLRHLFLDNASNFTSHEFVNWALKLDIHLHNSGTWHPAGNMHAETNIKKAKRAIAWLCSQYNWTPECVGAQLQIMAC